MYLFYLSIGVKQSFPGVLLDERSCLSAPRLTHAHRDEVHSRPVHTRHEGEFHARRRSSFGHKCKLSLRRGNRGRRRSSSRRLLEHLVPDFGNVHDSPTWSMIRFGFRSYFLEKTSREPCLTECRCYIKHDTAREFCKLSKPGCDMRSSDFYVIHKTSYAPLLSKLLDLKQANSKRIIDTAPMRSLANQWLILPQASIQTKLDIPIFLWLTKSVSARFT